MVSPTQTNDACTSIETSYYVLMGLWQHEEIDQRVDQKRAGMIGLKEAHPGESRMTRDESSAVTPTEVTHEKA